MSTEMSKKKKNIYNEVPSALSKEFFHNLIRTHLLPSEELQIKSLDIKSALGTGENFLSKIFRIKVSLEQPTKDGRLYFSFIAKRLGSEFIDGYRLSSTNAYEKEVEMYEEIIPSFEKLWKNSGEKVCFGPRYFTKITHPIKILIFEDLCDDQFEMVNRCNRLNLHQVHLVIEKLAKFHAASIIHMKKYGSFMEHFNRGIYNEKLYEEFGKYFERFSVSFVETMEEKEFAKKYIKSLRTWKNKLWAVSSELATANPNEFNVLNHGDLWSNNIMFQKDNMGSHSFIKFVDFQMGVYASPAIDLLYFIMLSIETKTIVENFDHIIEYYHQHLSQSLTTLGYSKIATLKQIHMDILKKSFYGTMQMCEGIPILQIDHDKDGVNFGVASLDNKESGMERIKILNTPRYLNMIKELLPFFGERGMLDIE